MRLPRPRWTNRTAGMWSLIDTKYFGICGTTPRNAGCVTFDFSVGSTGLWFTFGPHTSIQLWLSEDRCKTFEVKFCGRKCYSCRIFAPLSRETAEYLSRLLRDANIPIRKLPPRK